MIRAKSACAVLRWLPALLLVAMLPGVAAAIDNLRNPRFPGPLDHIWQSDAYWTRDFAVPGVNGSVSVIETIGADLYVGGWFSRADGVDAPGLVRFNGRAWDAFPIPNGEAPTAMLPDGGSMLVAGSFDRLAPRGRYLVARWNGNDVTPVGGAGMRGRVLSLLHWNGRIIAAGFLRFEQEPNASYLLAQLGRDGWTPLGPPVDNTNSFQVYDAAAFQGRIIVGGQFRTADPSGTVGLLALRGDGAAYDTVLAGPDVSAYRITKLEVHAGRLVAAGSFLFQSDPMNRINRSLAAWDGSTWTPLDDEFVGQVDAMRSTSTGLLIGGRLFPQGGNIPWNGYSVGLLTGNEIDWLRGLNGTGVLTFARWGGRVVAGGRRIPEPGTAAPFLTLAVREGDSWKSLALDSPRVGGLDAYYGFPGYASVQTFLDADGQWFAGGHFDVSWHPLGAWMSVGPVAKWESGFWATYGYGISQGTTRALAWYHDQLYAAGQFNVETPNGFVDTQLIRSNGVQWSPVEGVPPLGSVSSIAVFDDRLIVGGSFPDTTTQQVSGVFAYDGSTWSSVGSSILKSGYMQVNELLVDRGSLYAAGYFDSIGGAAARSIARWEGQSWQALGDGYHGRVFALTSYQGGLAVGGECYGTPCSPVMVWNGTAWSGLADAPYNVLALASRGDLLFVGGNFIGSHEYAGPDARLRAWNGREWHALGSGFSSELATPKPYPTQVFALGLRNDVLWVGGSFARVGGQPAMNVATWTGLTREARATRSIRDGIAVTPDPSRPGASVELEIAGAGNADVGIYDLAGRRLHTLKANPGSDRATATWDGRDAEGRTVPAGIYFARATREGQVIATKRLVRLP